MEHEGPHRKTIQHFEKRRDIHFLTFSCFHRMPFLASDEIKSLLAESISRALVRHAFDLLAFVFMPEHVHLLIRPMSADCAISSLLWSIKRPMAFRAKRVLMPTSTTGPFHFWQAGPGFDSNLRSRKSVVATADYIHMNPVRRGLAARADEYPWSSARQWAGHPTALDDALPRVRISR